MEDINEFYLNGWYYMDIVEELEYYKSAVEDPEEYEVDIEFAQEQLDYYNAKLQWIVDAFEEQRKPKVDYEDGSWV